ncbi:glycerate kinase [Sanguibacter sp. 25GB23B1]|uniref:glycerate kinase n=1 Tax=unclassified Sanguibacter TaxID=2645534 RepID=UPI0032AF0038
MKIVLAPDSFKESMTAREAAAAMERGVRAVLPDAQCVVLPMADGGEGTVDALLGALGGELVTVRVTGPLGAPVDAAYGWVADERLAIVEVAAAVGIALVPADARDPWRAGSAGVGEIVRDALDRGARRLVVGLGGTVTNDGGAGMLQALGLRLLDGDGVDLPAGPGALERLVRIDASGLDPRLARTDVQLASDVTNTLLGPDGASVVFGPQKGASPRLVERLDAALTVLGEHLGALAGRDVTRVPGSGAAGGLGAAFLAVCEAQVRSGIEVVKAAAHLGDALAGADLVLTGEGSVDAQTAQGKAPFGVARAAQRAGVPVIVFAGRVEGGAAVLYEHGVHAVVPITQGPCDLATALREGAANLEAAVATTCRVLLLELAQH